MAEQLFQIGVKGLIQNEAGQILLVGRHGKDQGAAHLDIPGGRMDTNESIIDALKRELLEEIGVVESSIGDLYDTVLSNITIPVGDKRIPLVLVVYRVQIPEDHQIILGDEEEVYEWRASSEVAAALRFKYPASFTDKLATL